MVLGRGLLPTVLDVAIFRVRLEATFKRRIFLREQKAGQIFEVFTNGPMLIVSERLEHRRFVVTCERIARKVNDEKAQIVDLVDILSNLAHLHNESLVVRRLRLGVKTGNQLLLQGDNVVLIILGEILKSLTRQIHVDLVIFHQLLNLWHFSNHFRHLS